MSSEKPKHKCPICDKEAAPRQENKGFPFCSQRCKMEDLGKWLDGNYVVPGPPAAPHDIARELIDQSD